MEGESTWVVNGIITIAVVILMLPLVAGVVESLDALVLLVVIMYVVYTAISGEAIDPHQPK
jgi:amino acid transporter